MRIPNVNAGPFRMSVVNMRTPHSRKHSHRHDQDSGNGHDHGHNHGHGKRHDHDQRQSSSRSPFATSFCFPTLVSTMKTARATATSTWQSGRRDVTEATSEGPPCVFAGANNLQPQCSVTSIPNLTPRTGFRWDIGSQIGKPERASNKVNQTRQEPVSQ